MTSRIVRRGGMAALLALTGSSAALAQVVPVQVPGQIVPSSASPDRVTREIAPEALPGGVEPAAPAGLNAPPPPPGSEQVVFTVQDVVLEGSTVYGPDDIRPFWDEFAGRQASLADMYRVAQEITAKYRNDGYILSLVFVPEQTVADGRVRLQAVEGYIDQVTIQGEPTGARSLVEAYGAKVAADRPLRSETLERYLLLANDLPGVVAQGVLLPSAAAPGAADLAIVITQERVNGFASVDNRGSRFIGPFLFVGGLQENSNLGLAEDLAIVAATSGDPEELQYGQLTGSLPLGTEGTRVGFSFSASHSEPGFLLEDVDLESLSLDGEIEVTHPVIRTREQNLTLGLSFEVEELDTDLDDFEITDDSIRVLRGRATYDVIDPLFGVNLVDVEVSQGLDILGASDEGDDNLSRPEADGTFTKLSGRLSRLQRLPANFNLLLVAAGQVSSDALLSTEEFGVGGSEFGRGFDPSELTGDHGFGATVELQYGDNLPFRIPANYELYGYYDFGKVWNIDIDGDDDDSLASVGAGVRLNVTESFTANLEVARQLTRGSISNGADRADDEETRVLFGLIGRF